MGLYTFQRDGVDLLRERNRAILADEMGLGKTVQALVAAKELDAEQVLVVCPNSMKGVRSADGSFLGGWAGETATWFTEDISIVDGWAERRVEQIEACSRVTIINYEVLSKHVADLSHHWDVIVFDEAHRVKNRTAKVTKAAKAVAKHGDNVWLLSGTPIMNSTSELWQLLNILFPRDREYTSYWRFVNKYCEVSYDYWGHAIVEDVVDPTDRRVRMIRQLIKPTLIRRTKPEVLKDMPRKTVQKVWVEMHPQQAKVYREMEDDMLTTLESGETIAATVVIAQIMRLKQIAICPDLMIPTDARHLWGGKMDALKDLIDALGEEKIVIFSQFKTAIDKAYDYIIDCTNVTAAKFTGDTSQDERAAIVDNFQTKGDPQVLFVTTQAGGTGLTLTAASHAIFLDKMWTPAMNLQAQDRLHRISQERPVTIYELLTEGTVEERIEKMLEGKQNVVDILLETAQALEARAKAMKVRRLSGAELLRTLYPERYPNPHD